MKSNDIFESLDGFVQVLGAVNDNYELVKTAVNNIDSEFQPFAKEEPARGGKTLESAVVTELKDLLGEKRYDAMSRLYQAYIDMLNI